MLYLFKINSVAILAVLLIRLLVLARSAASSLAALARKKATAGRVQAVRRATKYAARAIADDSDNALANIENIATSVR